MAQYDYSINDDFPNHKVAPSRLQQEIHEKSEILVALDVPSILTGGDLCRIMFKADLPAEQQTALNAVVAAHSGEPLPNSTCPNVKIVDTDTLDPDTAVSCTEDVKVDVVTGQSISSKDISFPFDVNIIAAEYYVELVESDDKDYFEAWGIAQGDPAIGGLTAPAAQDDTVINVSSTVFQYIRPGFYVEFQDQAGGIYRVDSMDSGAGTITLNTGLEAAVAAGKTIHIRRPFVPKKFVKQKAIRRIGDLSSGSSPLNAGDILRIHYHHYNMPTIDDWMAFTIIYLF